MNFPTTQSLTSLYSDLYKDVWGSRPRNLSKWVGREDELKVEVDKLQSELDLILSEERQEWYEESEVEVVEVVEVKETMSHEDLVALEMEELEMRLLRGEQINF